MKNFFVCFVGIDGSGKTTLSKSLVKNLSKNGLSSTYVWNRYTPILMKLPILLANKFIFKKNELFIDYNSYSNKKRGLFKHSIFRNIYENLLMIDYTIQMIYKIKIPLMLGKNIICDRYLFDTIISDLSVDLSYSELKMKTMLNFYLKICPYPDIVFLVDVPEEIAFKRKNDIPSIRYLKDRREICLTIGNLYDMILLNGTKKIDVLDKEILDCIVNILGGNR